VALLLAEIINGIVWNIVQARNGNLPAALVRMEEPLSASLMVVCTSVAALVVLFACSVDWGWFL
jgi:hypothetical protein